MSGDERSKFLEWHEEQKDKIFRNKEEHLAYCLYEIHVRSQISCAFRKLFLKMVTFTYSDKLLQYH